MALRFTRKFADQYARLPATIQSKVDEALILLESDYRHPGLHCHSIQGLSGIFEAYVDQKYRLTFERQVELLILRNVDNHDECLKNP